MNGVVGEEEEEVRELASLLLRAALLDSFAFGWELMDAIVSMVRSMTGCMDWGGVFYLSHWLD